MSFWNSKSKSGIKPTPPNFRLERLPAAKKPAALPSKLAERSQKRPSPALTPRSNTPKSTTRTPEPERRDSTKLEPGKRKAQPQRSPTQQRIESDSDDEDGSLNSFDDFSHKRQKVDKPVDLNRNLRSGEAFPEADGGVFEMIHAADLSSLVPKPKFGGNSTAVENVTVELKYPSASQRERYDLVFGRDKIDPAMEIFEIAKLVTEIYLTKENAKPFTDPNTGIIRKLERAKNMLSKDKTNKGLLDNFKDAVDAYNEAIEALIQDGVLSRNLDDMHHIPLNMVKRILGQVYDRAVSPKVDILKQYENGTDNVYGELLVDFVSKLFKETRLTSDQVFVDLGSGVGNVVLQAALEIGCESWGCEVMPNAHMLAKAQQKEFAARNRLWGIQTGSVRLEYGDFRLNEPTKKAMRGADVILVNNQAFTSDLNFDLVQLFLDLKDGCRIISLKSFVPDNYKITASNAHNPSGILDVVKGEYFGNSVSWTDVNGSYFIATKDSKRPAKFAKLG